MAKPHSGDLGGNVAGVEFTVRRSVIHEHLSVIEVEVAQRDPPAWRFPFALRLRRWAVDSAEYSDTDTVCYPKRAARVPQYVAMTCGVRPWNWLRLKPSRMKCHDMSPGAVHLATSHATSGGQNPGCAEVHIAGHRRQGRVRGDHRGEHSGKAPGVLRIGLDHQHRTAGRIPQSTIATSLRSMTDEITVGGGITLPQHF